MPQPVPPRSFPRRVRDRLATVAHVAVHTAGDQVRISRAPGFGRRRLSLGRPTDRYEVLADAVTLHADDAADLIRLATAGVLTGETRRLTLKLGAAPAWVAAAGPVRARLTGRSLRWRRHGSKLTVTLDWGVRIELHRALRDLLAAVLRTRLWPQPSGPVYGLDRTAYLAGASTWPQAHLLADPPAESTDPLGRPLGTYLPAPRVTPAAHAPVPTAVANPYGRRLVGAAARYQLGSDLTLAGPGGPLRLDRLGELCNGVTKYAVVSVTDVPTTAAAIDGLRALGACGVVFAAADPATRARLAALDLVVVEDPTTVTDLAGYALSVKASRQLTIAGDAALRRTALAGATDLALPAVSVLLSSVRPDHIESCLTYLAAQTYPALEVLVGLHGYDVEASTLDKWRELLPFPLRVVAAPVETPFGQVLGQLTRAADGELVTKVDDDDHYGPNHVTDLVLGWHTTGADLVAKGSRFVHFLERDQTIDRRWAAAEVFNVTIAGGTMLMARSIVTEVGGWSHSSKHVDTELFERLRDAGALAYRIHGLEYTYVRRSSGHTWQADNDQLLQQAEHTYPGLRF